MAYYRVTRRFWLHILLYLTLPFLLLILFLFIYVTFLDPVYLVICFRYGRIIPPRAYAMPIAHRFLLYAYIVVTATVVIATACFFIPSGIRQAKYGMHTREELSRQFPNIDFPNVASIAIIKGQTFAWTNKVLCLPYGALVPLDQIEYLRDQTERFYLFGISTGLLHYLALGLQEGGKITAIFGKVSPDALAPLEDALAQHRRNTSSHSEDSAKTTRSYQATNSNLAEEMSVFLGDASKTIYEYFVDHTAEAGEGKFKSCVGVTFDIPTTHNCGLIVLTYNRSNPSKHMLIASALREDEDEKLDDFIMTGTEAEIMKYLEDMDAHRDEWVEVFVDLSNQVDARRN